VCEVAGVDRNSDSLTPELIINHVKSLRDTRDGYHDEFIEMKKKMEQLEKEKYEIVDVVNER